MQQAVEGVSEEIIQIFNGLKFTIDQWQYDRGDKEYIMRGANMFSNISVFIIFKIS
jgi:hypothetical protein